MLIARPRVDERQAKGHEDHQPFSSALLPRFMRRTPTLETALATLYRKKGVSSNDFPTGLQPILGERAAGLSANTICRLKRSGETKYESLRKRPLDSIRYAYLWADGVPFRRAAGGGALLRAGGHRSQFLREWLAVRDGQRESEQSWK